MPNLLSNIVITHRKVIVAYYTSNSRFAIETNMCLTIPNPRDNIICCFCSHNVVESETCLVSDCPLYFSVNVGSPSMNTTILLMHHVGDLNFFYPKPQCPTYLLYILITYYKVVVAYPRLES